jgi:deoxyribodipyrimidine photo-lyase
MYAMPRTVSLPQRIDRGEIPALELLTTEPLGDEVAPGGESEGLARLRAWTRSRLDTYAAGHDDLPGDCTSRISPYLHFGCLSALEISRPNFSIPSGF